MKQADATNTPRSTGDRELRDRVARLGPWHHDIEVAPGVRTREARGPSAFLRGSRRRVRPKLQMAELVAEMYPAGLAGRSVLDCACNAGGLLFAAASLGAGRCFGFDVRDHWIRQARFLAEHLPSGNIAFDTFDLSALPERRLGTFDVTLFNGIFYHLPDPMAGLRVAADHTNELLVVNTAMRPGPGDALVLNYESVTALLSGVHRLAWLPTNDKVVRAALAWCGFPHTRLHFFRNRTWGNQGRFELLAAREESTFAHYDAWRARPVRRALRNWGAWLLRRD